MIKILVTGASGLVGSALVKVCAPDISFISISSLDADLRNLDQVNTMLSNAKEIHGKIDGIIHLAANVGGLFKNMAFPVEMFEDNLLMNTNILKAAHHADINNVVMCLSTCIFPDNVDSYPITSGSLHDGPPHPSNEGYAYAKRMSDVLARAYQKQYGRRYFCVVPTNIYGPHDNFDLSNAHVIPALIHKCWIAKRDNLPFVVAGDGTPLRQFIYSVDLAKMIVWAYQHYTHTETPFLICPPDAEIPISTVVHHIAEAFEYTHAITYDLSKPNGQYKKTAASCECTFGDFTTFEDGIKQTITWFLDAKHIRGIDLACMSFHPKSILVSEFPKQ